MRKLMSILFAFCVATFGQNASESIKDSRDGKTYKTIKIGEQLWMAEN